VTCEDIYREKFKVKMGELKYILKKCSSFVILQGAEY
jgi:hypothetical protein